MRFFVSFNWLLTITMRSHTLFHARTHLHRHAHTNTLTMFNQLIFFKEFLSSHMSLNAWQMPNMCLLSVRFARMLRIFCRIFFSISFCLFLSHRHTLARCTVCAVYACVCLSRMFTYIYFILSRHVLTSSLRLKLHSTQFSLTLQFCHSFRWYRFCFGSQFQNSTLNSAVFFVCI